MNVPILSRTTFYTPQASGTLRHLEWNLVQTTLGGMIEPRTLYRPGENVKLDDVHDSDFTDIKVLSKVDAGFYSSTPLFSNQWPKQF
ncbi:MAG TPA: hypothetical protein VF443_11190 [Nitrospira sp.]